MQPSPSLTRIVARVGRRLLPFLLLMYVLAFLDRANLGFAKAAFQADTGLSDAAYAMGASIFFLGYAVLEVPSNLLLHRLGARVWLSRIMVSWGLISAGMMFVHTETAFYVMRLALGAAEAGFFPGAILYLTYWFPEFARGRAMGVFYFGAPISFILGGPLSGALLEFDGLSGLQGWQWMFLIEGLLAAVVGLVAFRYLDNRPADAGWLSADEKGELCAALDAEEAARGSQVTHSFLASLRSPRLFHLAVIYGLIQASVYGVVFFLPTQVAGLIGKSVGFEVGIVTAIPWIFAIAAAYLLPRLSDATGKRRAVAAVALALAGVGIWASTTAASPPLALAALCLAAAGFIGVQPVFWSLPSRVLSGAAAAGGFAVINSFGALGGFIAPNLRAWAEKAFAVPAAGLQALAALTLLGAVLILLLRDPSSAGDETP